MIGEQQQEDVSGKMIGGQQEIVSGKMIGGQQEIAKSKMEIAPPKVVTPQMTIGGGGGDGGDAQTEIAPQKMDIQPMKMKMIGEDAVKIEIPKPRIVTQQMVIEKMDSNTDKIAEDILRKIKTEFPTRRTHIIGKDATLEVDAWSISPKKYEHFLVTATVDTEMGPLHENVMHAKTDLVLKLQDSAFYEKLPQAKNTYTLRNFVDTNVSSDGLYGFDYTISTMGFVMNGVARIMTNNGNDVSYALFENGRVIVWPGASGIHRAHAKQLSPQMCPGTFMREFEKKDDVLLQDVLELFMKEPVFTRDGVTKKIEKKEFSPIKLNSKQREIGVFEKGVLQFGIRETETAIVKRYENSNGTVTVKKTDLIKGMYEFIKDSVKVAGVVTLRKGIEYEKNAEGTAYGEKAEGGYAFQLRDALNDFYDIVAGQEKDWAARCNAMLKSKFQL